MTEKALNKKEMIAELTKSVHGKYEEYLPVGQRVSREDPDFFAHLVAWNHQKGQVRDPKVALPVISLAAMQSLHDEQHVAYLDNALAHLADIGPRALLKILRETKRSEPEKPKKGEKRTIVLVPPFVQTAKAPARMIKRLVARYLRDLELDRRAFEGVAVQHSRTLMDLYAHCHVSCPDWVSVILFHGLREEKKAGKKTFPEGKFDKIRQLHLMSGVEAAGTIVKHNIPFLIALGALGSKVRETDTVLALIKAMSPTELVTNMKWLESVGVKTDPVLRAALAEALGTAAKAKSSGAVFKTSRAAKALEESGDVVLSGKLHALQEKQIEKLGGIDGDWLIAGDCSGSMQHAIGGTRLLGGTLARSVKGSVHAIFFDDTPRYFDLTGKTMEQIEEVTRAVHAGGGTQMHVLLQYALDNRIKVDGIAVVGDGADHSRITFSSVYKKYCMKMDIEPVLYFYKLLGSEGQNADTFSRDCQDGGIDVQIFDLRDKGVDYYSIPNLAQTMRVSRYSLVDEILATPLRTLDEVLDRTKGVHVLPRVLTTA